MSGSILLFQRIVPSYRVPVFRRLHEELGVVVCHSIDQRSAVDSIDFPHEILPGRRIAQRESLYWQRVLPVLRKHRPAVIISQYSLGFTTFWKLLVLRPLFGYRLVTWSHGVRNRDLLSDRKSKHFFLTPLIFRMMDGLLFYSERRRDAIVERYPNHGLKSFIATNTMDTALLVRVRAELEMHQTSRTSNQEAVLRLVYFGKVVPSKKVMDLVRAYAILNSKHRVQLVIIGGGTYEQELRSLSQEIGFLYIGENHDPYETGRFLIESDVLIIPGAVGLAIVHGFVFGLPMITYRSNAAGPEHGPEIDFLHDGENGLFSEQGPEQLAATIERLILDPALLARMRENAVKTVENEANIDRMVEGFRGAIDYVMGRGVGGERGRGNSDA